MPKNVQLNEFERNLARDRKDHKQQRTFSKNLPVIEVRQAGNTLEYVPLPQFVEVEQCFTNVKGKCEVFFLNQNTGEKTRVYRYDPSTYIDRNDYVAKLLQKVRDAVALQVAEPEWAAKIREGRW